MVDVGVTEGACVGRHRSDRPEVPQVDRYVGAGKRKKVGSGRTRASGSHRAVRGAAVFSTRPRIITIPRLAGAIALAGAIGGSMATSGSSATSAAAAADRAGNARPSRASILAARSVPVSRAGSRVTGSVSASALDRLAARRAREIGRISRQADRRARAIEVQRWVLPMTSYRLTGRFGDRSSLWATVHTGLDFAARTGTPIRAVASGAVTAAGWAGPYGLRTIVLLPDGTEIWYCHQSRIDVGVGDRVERGDRIGAVGSTGNVTGPHLHLEVRPGGGAPVDPVGAFAQHGVYP